MQTDAQQIQCSQKQKQNLNANGFSRSKVDCLGETPDTRRDIAFSQLAVKGLK
jgi:hypothetical protein